MRRVLVIGGAGQLAYDLGRRWQERHPGDELVRLPHDACDVTRVETIEGAIQRYRPAVVVNCAAYHVVDEIESQPEQAFLVNSIGARNVALACRATDAVMLHMSTDYVFRDGAHPHVEDEAVDPPNVYGVSKAAGEMMIRSVLNRHFIVRSSGLYGVAGSAGKGGNFVETMLRLASQDKPITVVNDQVLTPTGTWALADQIALLLTTDQYGTYHATCQGQCSWFDFAAEIFRQAGLHPQLAPVPSAQRPVAATRPSYSVLDNRNLRRLGIDRMPAWQDSLNHYLTERRLRLAAAA